MESPIESSNEPTNASLDDEEKTISESSDSDQPGTTKHDSPAFRLRPRRSTPRKCEITTLASTSSSKRYTLYRPTETIPATKGGKMMMKYHPNKLPIKRMLFGLSDGGGKTAISVDGKSNLLGMSSSVPDDQTEDMFEQMEKLIGKEHQHRKPCPVVLEEIEFGVFAERSLLADLAASKSNAGHYVCVRIVHKCRQDEKIHIASNTTTCVIIKEEDEKEVVKKEEQSKEHDLVDDSAQTSKLSRLQQDSDVLSASRRSANKGEDDELVKSPQLRIRKSSHSASKELKIKSDHQTKLLDDDSNDSSSSLIQLLVQDVISSDQPGPLLRPTQPLLLLCLHGRYAQNEDKFQVGKLLELVRFEFESANCEDFRYNYMDKRMDFYPFILHMRLEPTNRWLPMISIKSAINQPDLSQLNVINAQALLKEQQNQQDSSNVSTEQSKDSAKFSSYVVKAEASDTVVSLHQTKSPTIKRFMKTISSATISTGGDRNHIKIKIKRNLT